jgi:general secretion pathway protein J
MSLLEVMVAIALITFMSFAAFVLLSSSIDTREILGERDEVTRSARVTLGKLRRELQLSFLTAHPEAINTYKTVFVGVDDNPDRLTFTSLAHQRLYTDSRECDQTELTWWADDAGAGGRYTLFHREAPRVDEEPDKGGVIYPLAYNVRTFNIRYLDSRTNEWTDTWDTRTVDQANRLPRAVQVGLVLVIDEQDGNNSHEVEVPVVTTVLLHYADELTASPFNPNALPPDADTNGGGGGGGFNGNSVPAMPTASFPGAGGMPGSRGGGR